MWACDDQSKDNEAPMLAWLRLVAAPSRDHEPTEEGLGLASFGERRRVTQISLDCPIGIFHGKDQIGL